MKVSVWCIDVSYVCMYICMYVCTSCLLYIDYHTFGIVDQMSELRGEKLSLVLKRACRHHIGCTAT